MEVGDYVRTKYGEICKLKKSRYSYLLYETDIEIDRHNDRDCNDCGFDSDTIKDIIKSSPNIIDLIQKGDYVNGKKVTKTNLDKTMNGETAILCGDSNYDCLDVIYKNRDIKSIVTKEQFGSMKYEIGE